MSKYYKEGGAVYNTRPYHALYLSDGEEEDDDICVWKEKPELPEPYENDDEPLSGHFRDTGSDVVSVQSKPQSKPREDDSGQTCRSHSSKRSKGRSHDTSQGTNGTKVEDKAAKAPIRESRKLSPEKLREREIIHALSAAHKSLTRMSQFILKLEARTGKATKEGIRQTLDATVRDNTRAFGREARDKDHKSDIDEIKNLSMGVSHRLWLVDRHWRRQERHDYDDEAANGADVEMHGEEFVENWLKVETRTNHLSAEETCFYTGSDLANNRSFREWLGYLRKLGNFRDTSHDKDKLIELAWCFLDRNLRGPLPPPGSTVEAFVLDLESKQRSGAFAEVLRNPYKQVEEDDDAWNTMRRYWSSMTFP
ncbi:hypothetical protein F5X99DRAFT_430825 [Biscogniauxia marginata]|nr:hypothetical protein F5X99DRAFT_430825 [Biscogniauxia marginata]